MWLLFIGVLAAAFVAYRSATTTTVVLVRHAEKELSTIDDPPLTAQGERRAERLAQMFGSIRGAGSINGIYVTDTRRAQQTAMPLASRLGLRPEVVSSTDVDAAARRVLSEYRGGTALVVAHSNTLPELVRKMSGLAIPAIADEEYDNVYVVTVPTVGDASVLRLKY
jgi:broad specificity phosphatase PhoE